MKAGTWTFAKTVQWCDLKESPSTFLNRFFVNLKIQPPDPTHTHTHTKSLCTKGTIGRKKIIKAHSVQSQVVVVQLLSHVWLFATPWPAACQASLSFTISRSLLRLMSSESVMPSNHLILCHPLLHLPSIFPRIKDFSNELVLHIRWPKYWSFSFSISPLNEYSGSISFRMDWRLDWSPCSPRDSQESSPAPQFESVNSSVLSLLYGSTLTSVHDYWENHSFDYQTVVSKVGTHMKLLFNLSHTPGSWRK